MFRSVAGHTTFDDGSTQTVTSLATWSSADTVVATVSNVAGSKGQATGVSVGMASITATYNGVTGTPAVTVQ